MQSCPLCGGKTVYVGAVSVECETPGCANLSPDYIAKQRAVDKQIADGILGWLPNGLWPQVNAYTGRWFVQDPSAPVQDVLDPSDPALKLPADSSAI